MTARVVPLTSREAGDPRMGGTVEERFIEASARGLDFLAITDHNDVRSQSDPGWEVGGVLGLP